MRRLIAMAAAALALAPLAARADGEAGLVIQVGDQVTTYCVPFTGESISGEALLAASGLPLERFGSGSGTLICAIGSTGCSDPSSFESCFCQCRGSECTYWAFFTRAYGRSWVYSSVGIGLAKAKDGDVHGWKWGRGSQTSAPAPADITFEQICGHPPRGGAAPTSTPPPPAPTPTAAAGPASPPASPAAGAPTATAATASPPASNASATSAPSPPATVAITLSPASPAPGGTPASAAGESAAGSRAEDGPNLLVRLGGFALVAGPLLAAIAAAAYWRRRRGR